MRIKRSRIASEIMTDYKKEKELKEWSKRIKKSKQDEKTLQEKKL